MKQFKFSGEQIKAIIVAYNSVVSSIKDEGVREGFMNMIDQFGDRLFEAPASPKLEYHNCCICGLAEHSLRVLGNLKTLANAFAPHLSSDSIIVTALGHDLGKLGTINEPYYIPQDNDWRMNNLGEMYVHNQNLIYFPVPNRSVRLLNEFGVRLTEEEEKAILIHDGQYVDANKPYAHKEGWLGLLLHQADMIACTFEKERWKRLQ